MSLREYRDPEGVLWRVWPVNPTEMTGPAVVPEDLRTGWLCFESEAEKRRLRPVPPSWEGRTDHELDILRRAADPVRRR